MTFVQALAAGLKQGKHLCVGIDPHRFLLQEWGLNDTAQGACDFGLRVVEAAAGAAVAVKPQIAFFERFGSAGYRALEQVFAAAREAGLPIIADVKRGDIGSTFAAYAEAWLLPGSPLEADAMTAVAYQGFGSLNGGLELVREHGKGLFVLAATSNPEARTLQQARRADNLTVASSIVREAQQFNAADELALTAGVGAVGVVLGATLQLADFEIDTALSRGEHPILPILAPGFGAQGAKLERAKDIFGSLAEGLISNESRGVLAGDPDRLAERVRVRAAEVGEALS
ncbi:orotidine-5'-phosphate decarboxylase [Canibacter zhoujuaniae]|uniref:orotidine-5'-phosphate decarboxylase n=1 Tax=Canibacter zhoujuaniae TaxID=2708343 RepID=UPI001AB03BF8|nr:orotidine-5'-phosphate decarboxylase [Canibacter zhoujuaniae]